MHTIDCTECGMHVTHLSIGRAYVLSELHEHVEVYVDLDLTKENAR